MLACWYMLPVKEYLYAVQASAARYARSHGRIEQKADDADREVHDFRCKLTTCKWREAPEQQPGRRMHARKLTRCQVFSSQKDGDIEQCCILIEIESTRKAYPSRITPAMLCGLLYFWGAGVAKNRYTWSILGQKKVQTKTK